MVETLSSPSYLNIVVASNPESGAMQTPRGRYSGEAEGIVFAHMPRRSGRRSRSVESIYRSPQLHDPMVSSTDGSSRPFSPSSTELTSTDSSSESPVFSDRERLLMRDAQRIRELREQYWEALANGPVYEANRLQDELRLAQHRMREHSMSR